MSERQGFAEGIEAAAQVVSRYKVIGEPRIVAAKIRALAPPAQTQQGLSEGAAWSISGGGHDKRSVEIVTPDGDVVAEVFGSPAHLETAQQRAEAICAARRAATLEKEPLRTHQEEALIEAAREWAAIDCKEGLSITAAGVDAHNRMIDAAVALALPVEGRATPNCGDGMCGGCPKCMKRTEMHWAEGRATPSNFEKQPSPAAAPAQLSAMRDALEAAVNWFEDEQAGPWGPVFAKMRAALAGQPAPTAPTEDREALRAAARLTIDMLNKIAAGRVDDIGGAALWLAQDIDRALAGSPAQQGQPTKEGAK